MGPEVELLQSVLGIAKDLTLTSFLLWFLFLLMTGRVVRREELDTAVKTVEKADAKADWWRDKYMGNEQSAKEVLATQGSTIAALKGTLDSLLASMARRDG